MCEGWEAKGQEREKDRYVWEDTKTSLGNQLPGNFPGISEKVTSKQDDTTPNRDAKAYSFFLFCLWCYTMSVTTVPGFLSIFSLIG